MKIAGFSLVLVLVAMGLCSPCLAMNPSITASPLENFNAKRDQFYMERENLRRKQSELSTFIAEAKVKLAGEKETSTEVRISKEKHIWFAVGLAGVSFLIYLATWKIREKKYIFGNTIKSVPTGTDKSLFVIFIALFLLLVPHKLHAQSNQKIPDIIVYGFRDKLIETEELINANDLEKAILILEKKRNHSASIPSFEFQNPLVDPLLQVKIDSSEYYYTLAALNHVKSDKPQVEYYIEKFIKSDLHGIDPNERRLKLLYNILMYFQNSGKIEPVTAVAELIVMESDGYEDVLFALESFINYKLIGPSLKALDALKGMALEKEAKNQAFAAGKKLTQQMIADNQSEFASASAEKTIPLTDSHSQLLEFADFCKTNKLDKSASSIIDEAIKRYPFTTQLLEVAQLNITWGNVKKAEEVIDQAIDNATDSKSLLSIAEFCIQRDQLDRAIHALQMIFQYFSNAVNDTAWPPNLLYPSDKIPKKDKIKLLTLLGICLQKENKPAMAEDYFRKAVEIDIDRFISIGGFNSDMHINDMFYLLHYYVNMNNIEMMNLLDPIYTHLEEQYLLELKNANEALVAQRDRLEQELLSADLLNKEQMGIISKKKINITLNHTIFWLCSIFATLFPWIIDWVIQNKSAKKLLVAPLDAQT